MSKPIYKWSEWPEPQWLKYKKHIPPTQMKWDELVKSTADGPALYHPNIDIQAHEMRAVKSGLISPSIYDLHCLHPNICEFWYDFGYVIGACSGEETQYIIVRWQVNGGQNEVHGHPKSREELCRRGAKL